MFNCVRPPEEQTVEEEAAEGPQLQDGHLAGAAASEGRRRPPKVSVRLRLMELEGVTLSHGVLFAKVRLVGGGGRFCQHSEHREIRDNRVCWTDAAATPMEFACRLGPGAAPAHLRVSVRREERGGRSYTKVGYAVLDIGDLPWVGDTEHKCILSPYSQDQRLDNSTLRLSLHLPHSPLDRRLLLLGAGAPATDTAAEAATEAADGVASAGLPSSTSSATLASLAGGGGGGLVGGHRRNASNFSACSVRTHSRNNSLEQDAVFTSNSSQSSSVPSFDLMPSSLERRRTGLTPTRELNSRIANTRTDNFEIVKEVLEREGILLVPETPATG